MRSCPCRGGGPQYLDGDETQEAAGFRKQGGEVIRVDNQHLCGEALSRVRVRKGSSGEG